MKIKNINRIRNILTLILLCANLHSCEQVLDNFEKSKEEQKYVSPYRGTYTGTYSGDIAGNLTIQVSQKGWVDITRTYPSGYESYSTGLNGSSLDTGNTASSGFLLRGNLESKTGIWEMGSLKGNWIVHKN